jgi:hypothetical protein
MKALSFLFAFLLVQSCATIKISSDGEAIESKKRIFYVVNGLAPISNNTVKAGEQYETKHDFIDILITGFTGGIIYSRTVEKK